MKKIHILPLVLLFSTMTLSAASVPKLIVPSDLMTVQTSKGVIIKPATAKDSKDNTPQFEMFLPNKAAYNNGDAPTGTSPVQLRKVYGLKATDQGGGAIAIVDAGHNTKPIDDANEFNKKYNLPLFNDGNITLIKQGEDSPFDLSKSWEIETTLDLEAAHLMAPNTHIILVEAGYPLDGAFAKAITMAATELQKYHGGEISMSWGGPGDTEVNKPLIDAMANLPINVSLFAASGDNGSSPAMYPASSADVVAVGGTTLHFDSAGNATQTAWSGSGGGLSLVYDRAAYQAELQNIVGKYAGTPDIALEADLSSGILVYVREGILTKAGFELVGGTSLSAPLAAGLHNIYVNQHGHVDEGTQKLLLRLYSKEYQVNFLNNMDGINGNLNNNGGYDLVTGLGAPKLPV